MHNTIHIFNKYAQVYQDQFMDVSLYQKTLDYFLKLLPSNANILEVACGPGNITKYLLQQQPYLNILATDLAPNMLNLARKNNPSAHIELLDMKDISTLKQPFNAIVCAFGFPYLSKQEALQWIKDVSKMLKSKGVLYISTMEDDHKKSGIEKGRQGDEMWMNYHEAGYLTKSLHESGFKTIQLERIVTQPKDKKVTDLMIIAQKI